jgi:hypothetical protein
VPSRHAANFIVIRAPGAWTRWLYNQLTRRADAIVLSRCEFFSVILRSGVLTGGGPEYGVLRD